MVDPTSRLTPQEEKDLNKFQKFFSYKVHYIFTYRVYENRITFSVIDLELRLLFKIIF